MTWKEFKEAVEAQGIEDQHNIWYIDVTPLGLGKKDIVVERTTNREALWAIWS